MNVPRRNSLPRMEGLGHEIETGVTGNDDCRLKDQGINSESMTAADCGSVEHHENFAAQPRASTSVQAAPAIGNNGLGKRLPFADANGAIGRKVVPPSSFQSCLLAGCRNPGAFGSVAARAGGDEVLHAGGSALGPWVEMVAVLGWPGTTALEP